LSSLSCCMTSDRIIVEALKLAHRLLCPNPHLRGTGTVLRLREVVHSPSVRSALERGSDSLPAFALREIARVLSDFSQTPGETIARIPARQLLANAVISASRVAA
jgi:hypothetical protein